MFKFIDFDWGRMNYGGLSSWSFCTKLHFDFDTREFERRPEENSMNTSSLVFFFFLAQPLSFHEFSYRSFHSLEIIGRRDGVENELPSCTGQSLVMVTGAVTPQ